MNHFKFLSQCHTFGTLFTRTSHVNNLILTAHYICINFESHYLRFYM